MSKSTEKNQGFRIKLIAPCGMNCRLCHAYIREKNACPGCREDDDLKTKTRVVCRIKNCEKLVHHGAKYCYQCDSYPCEWLNHLDKRYTTKYGMSMIDNLNMIKKSGVKSFIKSEMERWACRKCGETVSVHKPQCLYCGRQW